MKNFVFEDKDSLVKFLYRILENPTRIKIQKTLYLLYAFYGATYGQLKETTADSQFSDQKYPKELFNANFEAWKYGPVEYDIYKKDVEGYYETNLLTSDEELMLSSTSEYRNVRGFVENIAEQTGRIDDFSLVDRTHQDNSWINVYREGEMHTKMDNSAIISEYVERYID